MAITPTLLSGGSSESIVPDEAQVLLDIRTLPGQSHDEIVHQIDESAKRFRNSLGHRLEIKNCIPSALSDPNCDFIKTLQFTHKRIFDRPLKLRGSGPANEGYQLIERGVPTVSGYGPRGHGAHGENEYADLSSFEESLEFMVELAINHYRSLREGIP